ncbi:gliding motility-associated C-terminal domain-containing protein, partial [Mesonia mobilis]|uniref:gliding motility-associated C-terminal domain-containing protein n=1 Tax=Mesonia mobilis TaxID=369791 RepID=UPI0026F3365F
LSILFFTNSIAQDIELYTQFNGRYDYTAIGATLNSCENNLCGVCEIDTSAAATLTLEPSQNVVAAYLYWAGSGEGDFEVNLNGFDITAERTFNHTLETNGTDLLFFSAFADVTSILQNAGNETYFLSELDLQEAIIPYCNNATNFGGWSITIIYEDASLPLNQLSIFDGLQGVSVDEPDLTIQLNNLSVIDNEGAKIGFLAWEGDSALGIQENLFVNGNEIFNEPLNPEGNVFNGTNSFTNSDELYNMDLDFFNIENNINIGDTSATIQLHTGGVVNVGTPENPVFQLRGDLILINNVVTVLNSILPDPSPQIDTINTTCFSSEFQLNYVVNNFNCTGALAPNTPILFYIEDELVGQTSTQNSIPIDGSEAGQINITLPNNVSATNTITMIVNEDVDGNIIVPEINNDNNSTEFSIAIPVFNFENALINLEACENTSNPNVAIFDLTENTPIAIGEQENIIIDYFLTENQAENNQTPIDEPTNFENSSNPQEIFVRITFEEDEDCYLTDSFFLNVNRTPISGVPNNLTACEYQDDSGISIFDLSVNDDLITNTQNNTSLDYYTNLEDLANSIDEIEDIQNFENTTNPQTIYTKLFNSDHPECYTISSFELEVTSISMGNIIEEFKACDPNGLQATFDLTQNTSIAINNQSDVNVRYFETFSQADNNSDFIINPSSYPNQNNPQEIFIRISSNNNEDCYIIDSFIISVFDTPEAYQPADITLCDDSTNDEIALFNLTENESTILNGQDATINYYTSQEDADLDQNQITTPTNYTNTSNPEEIFVRLSNEELPECYTTTSFTLNINSIDNIPLNETLLYCDEGFNLATFDLTEIEEFLPLSNTQIIENYYTSAEDASFITNPITTPSSYGSISNPQQIFIRVEEQDDCYKIYDFNITVENCPPFIPEGFSPNNDGINDTFEISGLYNIFENFELKIFNRYGTLIYQGNNDIPEWDGTSNEGLTNQGKELPTGTYYYILNLNDPNYDIYRGWVYLNR